jgi:hypothetical protein
VYADAGPDLHLFWPGTNATQCAQDHLEFVAFYYGIEVGSDAELAIVPCFYRPANAYGFAIWVTRFF